MAKKIYRLPFIGKKICPHEGKKGQVDIFIFCLDCGKNLGSPYEGKEIKGFKTDMKTGKSIPVTWIVVNGELIEKN